MKTPYDNNRYLEWCNELQELITEFLNTEGNTAKALMDEINNAMGNAKDEIEG